MILPQKYFLTQDTVGLAQDLVGKYLVRGNLQDNQQFLITEVEAYHGQSDKACHARFGRTPRNWVMFDKGGVWYVYLCYGIHWLLNIVSGDEKHPAAVLIRGISGANGPGRVTKLLGIDKKWNGLVSAPNSGLWIEDQGYRPHKIIATPRIGIPYAAEYQAKLWRFVLVNK